MGNQFDLAGKHIIITGASSGIGRETCILASKYGAKISMIGRNQDRLEETKALLNGSGHSYYSFDLSNIEQIDGLIKSIVSDVGSVDGMVHCAGIGLNRPIKLMKPDFVKGNMVIHYYAFVELIRAITAKGRVNGDASLVGISSVAAFRGDRAQGAYTAAKAAMSAVVHPLAKELAPKGIRINTIAFGMVETDMYKGFLKSGGNDEELLRNQYLGIIPKEYAANAICFMLSDASKYMTGQTMVYDAGCLT